MARTKSSIAQATARFVAELTELLELELREQLIQRISGGVVAPPTERPRKAAGSAGRVRRSTADLENVKQALLNALTTHPGSSSEQLQEQLAISAKELRGPLLDLRHEQKVRATGERRDMRYFAATKPGAKRRKTEEASEGR